MSVRNFCTLFKYTTKLSAMHEKNSGIKGKEKPISGLRLGFCFYLIIMHNFLQTCCNAEGDETDAD